MLRVALGTAIVLGLAEGRMLHPPTNAHLLVGTACPFNCTYCGEKNSRISRISWPAFPEEEVIPNLKGKFERVCIQVTGNGLSDAVELIKKIKKFRIPVSVAVRTGSMREIELLFSVGADRIGIPLDAASAQISEKVERGGFEETISLLESCAKKFPGKITTHLIIGLGESEQEAIELICKLYSKGTSVALFAFTPVRGARMEGYPKPKLSSYRRIQIARWLIANGIQKKFTFNSNCELVDWETPSPEAFCTSGCAGCNRPYFDSSPSGTYNYPYMLSNQEYAKAIGEANRRN